jgi:RNA polymerase sigma factor (sigma-70 family)
MTVDMIVQSQSGRKISTLTLVTKFEPLLRKYAYLLNYDDAYNDLLVDYLELIKKMNVSLLRNIDEGSIVSYIQKSVYSCYIKRSKSARVYITKNSFFCELSDGEIRIIDMLSSLNDDYKVIENIDIRKSLSRSEYIVIHMFYYSGYSVAEIARHKKVSRQAVNQTKNNALKKLNKLYEQYN